jgi:two-component system, OmpR family, phosphate regulon sensor histidine kinase PhoR
MGTNSPPGSGAEPDGRALGQSFAEIESRRQELAAMLDSMQEAVVAITPEGYVRWSNAVMQRIAGTQIRPGRPLVHSVRDPEVLACIRARWRTRSALWAGQFAGAGAHF